MGELVKNLKSLKSRDAILLYLSADPKEKAREFLELNKALTLKNRMLLDPGAKVHRTYDAVTAAGATSPAVFIIDKSGMLRWLHYSEKSSDRPAVETIQRELDKLAHNGSSG